MKKFYLGLVSLMLIMLHSCSQDELESTPINEPQAIKVVISISRATLLFAL